MGRDGVDVETWWGRVWRWAKPVTTGEALRLDQASKEECWRCCIRRCVQTPYMLRVPVSEPHDCACCLNQNRYCPNRQARHIISAVVHRTLISTLALTADCLVFV